MIDNYNLGDIMKNLKTLITLSFLVLFSQSVFANSALKSLMIEIRDTHKEIGSQIYDEELNEDTIMLSAELMESILLAKKEIPTSVSETTNIYSKKKKLDKYKSKIQSLADRCQLMINALEEGKNIRAKYHHFYMTMIMIGGHVSFR